MRVTWFALVVFAIVAGSSPLAHGQETDLKTNSTHPLIDPAILKAADGVERNVADGTRAALLPVLYPSSHASNLYQLKNGDILCVWFSGTWEGDSNVGIVVSRLAKGSTKWTVPALIDRREGESFQNPTVFQSPDGIVHMYHTTQPAHGPESAAEVLEVSSTDNGRKWTAPKPLFGKPGSYTRHPPLFLADGTWLLPLTYVTSAGIGKGAETNYPAVELSRDNGKTWKECLIPGANARVQPTTVKTASGFVTFFRDRASASIYRSESANGCDWSAPVATVLPNNNASVQAFALHDGKIVMVFDNSRVDKSDAVHGLGLRKPLSIAISDDAGKTWSHVRDVETGREGYGKVEGATKEPGREEYSYPSVMQAGDGMIYVSYTFRRQTIKVVSFPESWIATGGQSEGLYTAR